MKHIFKLFIVIHLLFIWASCEMPLQVDYEYDPSTIDPHINMTAWEFLNSRKDLFSIFIEAIEYAEMEYYYQQTDSIYTYLALTNAAMENYMKTMYPNTGVSILDYDRNRLIELIKYHIIEGRYSSHYYELPVEAIFVPTLLKGETGLMTMLVRKSPWTGATGVGAVVINETGSNGNSPIRYSRTSNIMPTNGVIHVFDLYAFYRR